MDDYYGTQQQPDKRATILRMVIGVALILLIGLLVVWLVFLRGNDNKKDTANTKTPSTSQQGKLPGDSESANNNDNSTPGNSATIDKPANDSTTTNNSTSSSSDNTTQSDQDLANTGPGDVIALFVVAVLVGSGLRRYQLSRR